MSRQCCPLDLRRHQQSQGMGLSGFYRDGDLQTKGSETYPDRNTNLKCTLTIKLISNTFRDHLHTLEAALKSVPAPWQSPGTNSHILEPPSESQYSALQASLWQSSAWQQKISRVWSCAATAVQCQENQYQASHIELHYFGYWMTHTPTASWLKEDKSEQPIFPHWGKLFKYFRCDLGQPPIPFSQEQGMVTIAA